MLKQSSPALDRVFHALSDPSRRAIVERLSAGSSTVSELAEPLPMSPPAVLQHIRALEDSGLVRSEKVGRVGECSIDAGALLPVERWIEERRARWDSRQDRLGTYRADQVEPLKP